MATFLIITLVFPPDLVENILIPPLVMATSTEEPSSKRNAHLVEFITHLLVYVYICLDFVFIQPLV